MAWRGRGMGRGRSWGPWPGRGPFSHLPPWLRPGWVFGRGACWWLYGTPWLSTAPYYWWWYRAAYAYPLPYYVPPSYYW